MSTLTPQDFVSKWKRVTSREKQTYQEHFIDLCRLVDHQTPNVAHPTQPRRAAGRAGQMLPNSVILGGNIKARIQIHEKPRLKIP